MKNEETEKEKVREEKRGEMVMVFTGKKVKNIHFKYRDREYGGKEEKNQRKKYI